MRADRSVILVGASTRAAAFSALRAGLRPWCADLFADRDLQARCPVQTLAAAEYPNGFLRLLREAPPGPVLYTGALENRPDLIRRLTETRPVWGNPPDMLRRVRSPFLIQAALQRHGLPCPAVARTPGAEVQPGRWLLKPLRGAGGAGIRFWEGDGPMPRGTYLQQYLVGESVAAVFVGDGASAELLGVTRQLVGKDWLHAAPFHYCGSVGPLPLTRTQRGAFLRLGAVLAETFQLRGLFGVDCLLQDGVPYPVEVNPRYTASVEVLEYATGLAALHAHRARFDETLRPVALRVGKATTMIGKAVYFAPHSVTFPETGPWQTTLRDLAPIEQLPAFADLPAVGEQIPGGRPVLTCFARDDTPEACLTALRRTARALDQRFAATHDAVD